MYYSTLYYLLTWNVGQDILLDSKSNYRILFYTLIHIYRHIHIITCIYIQMYKYLYCKTQTILLLLFSREVVSHPFITPWIVARQAPSLHGISQARIWNGLAFPCQGTFPTKELNLILRWQEDSLPLNHQGSPKMILLMV